MTTRTNPKSPRNDKTRGWDALKNGALVSQDLVLQSVNKKTGLKTMFLTIENFNLDGDWIHRTGGNITVSTAGDRTHTNTRKTFNDFFNRTPAH